MRHFRHAEAVQTVVTHKFELSEREAMNLTVELSTLLLHEDNPDKFAEAKRLLTLLGARNV